jgi:hypothetical protein
MFVFRETCLQLSPLNNLCGLDFTHIMAKFHVKVLVVYAENDSPAFHFQSKQFAKVSYFYFILCYYIIIDYSYYIFILVGTKQIRIITTQLPMPTYLFL